MALFPGGVELAVAEQVTEASIDELDSLVAKQLVVRHARRLSMLETIREYALEKLDQDPDADLVRERLAGWCLDLAGEVAPRLRTRDRPEFQARLDREMPNVRTALSWAIDAGRHDDALRLVAELWPLLGVQRSLAGGAALDRGGARTGGGRLAAVAGGGAPRVGRGWSGRARGDRFRANLEQARALFAESGDDAGVAQCLAHLAKERAWFGEDAAGSRAR